MNKSKAILFLLACFFIAIITTGCSKKTTEITAKPTSTDTMVWKVGDGFSPAEYGGTFDTLKQKAIKELIGEGAKRVRKVNLDENLLMTWRVKAALEIEERAKKGERKSYLILTKGYWALDAVFLDDFGPNEAVDGKWIKFNENLTYEYGKYENRISKGLYYYEPNFEKLILLDEKENNRPLEYQVGWSGEYVIFAGTELFDDGEIRIKMFNRQTQPVRYKK
jgi:hypothetical protein